MDQSPRSALSHDSLVVSNFLAAWVALAEPAGLPTSVATQAVFIIKLISLLTFLESSKN